MTRFKKCDDCSVTLGKTYHRVKTKGGFGESKSVIRDEGGRYLKEVPTVIYLCENCYNFHVADGQDGEVRKGSALDKVLDKHSVASQWIKGKKMDEMLKKISQQT